VSRPKTRFEVYRWCSRRALRAQLSRGLKKVIPSRLRAMFGSIFRREKVFVFERTLADGRFKVEAKVKVDVRIIQRDDFPRIAKMFQKFKIKEVDMACFAPVITIAKEKFKMGHICVVADMHGNIVHSKWIAFNEVYAGLLERKMRMTSDSAYVYGSYTVPEYRGLGIAPKTMEKGFSYLYERGIRKVYSCISHNNFPSLRLAHKQGYRKIGTITYTKIFKSRLYRCEGETEEDYNKLKSMFFL